MGTFNGTFKSFGALQTAMPEPVAKSTFVPPEKLSMRDAVKQSLSHTTSAVAPKKQAASEYVNRVAQMLRTISKSDGTGYCAAMKDQRYDRPVIKALLEHGATEERLEKFMRSEAGSVMASAFKTSVAKMGGIGGVAVKSYDSWAGRNGGK